MTEQEWLEVESLDGQARGVARRGDGKVVFIEGALPGEQVRCAFARRKNQWEQGALTELRRESAQRVVPACPHFGLHPGACGGCRMQHLHPMAQVAVKQRVLEDDLWHLAKVKPRQVLPPIFGPTWGYRQRARLSVRHVAKKGEVLVGFHERKSSFVADMRECPVLPARMSALLLPLRTLIGSMNARDRLPQIEVAAGDDVLALVLRHLDPLDAGDRERLRRVAAEHGVQWWLQPKGPDSVERLDPGDDGPAYALPESGVIVPFLPTDFTQVNGAINRLLVARALRLLDTQPGERVIDWFCGLGNFSLAIARSAAEVVGIEGHPGLVRRAMLNAERNGLAARARFEVRDLFELDGPALTAIGSAQRWLVDPPREGAFALAKALTEVAGAPPPGWAPPQRIVYVSCNPATLARDSGLLVHQAGYRCSAAGVVNMFPHTAHVESIAVFERDASA